MVNILLYLNPKINYLNIYSEIVITILNKD